MKGGSISISRGSCFLLFLVTLICIEYDAFVCFNVFVTLTPMGFLLFFAVFTKSTKQLVLNMAAMERIACFLFCNIDAGGIGRGRNGKEIVQNLLSPTDQFHIWGRNKGTAKCSNYSLTQKRDLSKAKTKTKQKHRKMQQVLFDLEALHSLLEFQ